MYILLHITNNLRRMMFSNNNKLLCASIAILFQIARCRLMEEINLNKSFPSVDYDKRIKPNSLKDDTATEVKVNMFILTASNFNEKDMEYDIQIYFRQYWQDDRLSYNNVSMKFATVDDPNLIWIPDLFFVNEKEGHTHDISVLNRMIKIHPDGNVSYSQRLTLTLKCPMNFSNFPFDVQNCPIIIESYGFNTKDMSLQWKFPDPISISENYKSLPLVSLKHYWATRNIIDFKSDSYVRLTANLQFSRKLTYYAFNVYIPCMMLTMLSWTSFWIRKREIICRTLIGISTILCMSLMVYLVNSEFPKVSYTRAIDIFTGISLTNCFLTLLVTIFIHSKDDAKEVKENFCKETNQDVEVSKNETVDLEQHDKLKRFKIWIFERKSGYSKIDIASRILFPTAYFLFVLCYFSICLNLRD